MQFLLIFCPNKVKPPKTHKKGSSKFFSIDKKINKFIKIL